RPLVHGPGPHCLAGTPRLRRPTLSDQARRGGGRKRPDRFPSFDRFHTAVARTACHGGVVPDRIFDEPRLAAIYDALDTDRRDLDVYASIAREVDARSVLDIGCGTGTFACMLAAEG